MTDSFTAEGIDEPTLIEGAMRGDASAFVRLIKYHDDVLRGLAYSMTGSVAGMEDVLQEAYLKAFRSIRSYKKNSSFKTWIWRIVHNTAIDESRRGSRLTLVAEVPESSVSLEGEGSGHEVDPVSLRLDIDSALQRLSPEQRAVVLLIDGEGFDYASAAKILGIPSGTVSSRINSARSELRKFLAPFHKDTER